MTTKFVWAGSGNTTLDGASWETAYANLTSAYAAVTAGDTIFVSHDHAETSTAAMSLTSPGTPSNLLKVICQNRTTGVAAATANVTTTGSASMTITGSAYYYGICFSGGSSASGNPGITMGSATSVNATHVLDSCKLQALSNLPGGFINLGSTTSPTLTNCKVLLSNTVLRFGNVGQGVFIARGNGTRVTWRDTPSAISALGSIPTVLFKYVTAGQTAGPQGEVLLENIDLSALTSGKTLVVDSPYNARFVMKRVRLGSSVGIVEAATANTTSTVIIMDAGTSGGTPRNEKYNRQGYIVQDRTIVKTGGSLDKYGLTSKKITTTTFSSWFDPFETLPWTVWNTAIGTSNTITVHGIFNSTVLPNNDEIWISADYLNTANADGVMVNSTIANPITANTTLSADTSVWNGAVAARIDSTVYVLNDVVKTSNNSSRIFFCTTAGTSNTAEPAGYTTAVDGSAITDGTAAFTAGMRFKMSASFNAGQVGSIFVKVHAAKTSNTYYVDQNAVIS